MRRVLVLALVFSSIVPDRSSAQAPSFAYRGVIEGFYGPPWTHQARLDQLRWMGAHGMNVYVQAPKDDGYQRANWREPYPLGRMAEMREEIAAARAAGVAWVPNLSPGFSLIPGRPEPGVPVSRDVCFTCPADREHVYAKLDPFFDAGARTLMISFDDVQKISSHPEDTAAYGVGAQAYGRMNREFLNAVYRRYRSRDAAFTLLTVLADYSGTSDTDYLRGALGLDSGIEIMWTGTAVVSRTIDPAEAAAYAGYVGREKVLVWDNYPVNDYTGGAIGRATRLFLGPYKGRPPDLPASVSGILANPMNEPVASRIALACIAAYLNDPAGYDAEGAWDAAVAELGASYPGSADAIRALAENSRSSTLDRTESPVFVARRDAFLAALDAGPYWTGAHVALDAEGVREHRAWGTLLNFTPGLSAEVGRWADTLGFHALVIIYATAMLSAQRPFLHASLSDAGVDRVRVEGVAAPPSPAAVAAYQRTAQFTHAYSLARSSTMGVVHGDRLAQDFSSLYAAENRVDEYVAEADRRTSLWLPAAPQASSRVVVTVQGRGVRQSGSGYFSVEIPRPSGPVEVVATDGAGGQTGLRL